MWPTISMMIIFASPLTTSEKRTFQKHHMIFKSSFNITRLLVPADGTKYVHAEPSDLPSIFFTVVDSRFDGGSCIYALEDLAAYEILEGGRDSTADYSSDVNVYFGSKDGIYKYDRNSLSAKKYGSFTDDIIQIQKANMTDKIYYLTKSNKLYHVENNGTVKNIVKSVACATQFVLDTSNNIYYVQCDDQVINVIKTGESRPHRIMTDVSEVFNDLKLLRPAFVMDDCIPLFGDRNLYILYANGTYDKKDFYLDDSPSAYSVDAAFYLIAALDGNIYEYNVMEVLLQSLFGRGYQRPQGIIKIIMSVIGSSRDNLYGFYKDWYRNE